MEIRWLGERAHIQSIFLPFLRDVAKVHHVMGFQNIATSRAYYVKKFRPRTKLSARAEALARRTDAAARWRAENEPKKLEPEDGNERNRNRDLEFSRRSRGSDSGRA
jgi:hypothetical protein